MISSTLLAIIFNLFSPETNQLEEISVIPWHEASIFQLPTQGDAQVEKIVGDYLQDLAKSGLAVERQGVSIQSYWADLASHQPEIPAPAASLTKVATTIAAIETWGLERQFSTKIYTTGTIQDGVLAGDLVVEGGGDPLFVWEEAIALGNSLNQLGIQAVRGNLIVVGDFSLNFKDDPLTSARELKQALSSSNWTPTIAKQYQGIEPLPPRPQVLIQGNILRQQNLPDGASLLLTHQSLKLREILKLMNVYSNNKVAESLARQIGGGAKITEIISKSGSFEGAEIQLINGSGLGVNNKISPRAACRMYLALEKQLEDANVTIADLFPVAGIDRQGTIEGRDIPPGIPVKTGTLATVSALSGAILTRERGTVCFAIVNYGNDIERLRLHQDMLLKNLERHWQITQLTPSPLKDSYFGDPARNQRNGARSEASREMPAPVD